MENVPLENLFLIDIETVSEKPHYHHLDDRWKALWETKIGRTLPPNVTAEEYYPMKAAIMAEFAKVVCISFGYFNREGNGWQLRIKSICNEDEQQLLSEFVQTLDKIHDHHARWIFTGHNIREFDVPFLCRRLLVNGIPLPDCINFQNKKPWETPVLDTLHLWRFGDYKNYTSLNLLAAVLGVPSPKDDIDGSQVGEVFWKQKDLNRISVYCEKDVATVANIILRLKGQKILDESQITFVGR